MTALSEALVAAQRQAIAALSKSYVADPGADPDGLRADLDEIGCTDKVEQTLLIAALSKMAALGAQAPEPTKPDTTSKTASKSQVDFAKKLADERGTVLPGYTLTSENASTIIGQLKAGTYNPDEWTVPF